jgi:hypothetical protein
VSDYGAQVVRRYDSGLLCYQNARLLALSPTVPGPLAPLCWGGPSAIQSCCHTDPYTGRSVELIHSLDSHILRQIPKHEGAGLEHPNLELATFERYVDAVDLGARSVSPPRRGAKRHTCKTSSFSSRTRTVSSLSPSLTVLLSSATTSRLTSGPSPSIEGVTGASAFPVVAATGSAGLERENQEDEAATAETARAGRRSWMSSYETGVRTLSVLGRILLAVTQGDIVLCAWASDVAHRVTGPTDWRHASCSARSLFARRPLLPSAVVPTRLSSARTFATWAFATPAPTSLPAALAPPAMPVPTAAAPSAMPAAGMTLTAQFSSRASTTERDCIPPQTSEKSSAGYGASSGTRGDLDHSLTLREAIRPALDRGRVDADCDGEVDGSRRKGRHRARGDAVVEVQGRELEQSDIEREGRLIGDGALGHN